MNTDISTTLQDTTPRDDQLPRLDLERAHQRAQRSRVTKRVAGVGTGLAVVAIIALAAVHDGGVAGIEIENPGYAGRATSSSSTGPDELGSNESSADWAAMSLDEALERLQQNAREHGALPEPASDQTVEIRTLGVSVQGEVGADREPDWWLSVVETGQRRSGDETVKVLDRTLGELPSGTTLEQVRTRLAAVEPAGDEAWRGLPHPRQPDEGPIGHAEELATDPQPFEPQPGETERPDRVYALVRLQDALRQSIGDQDVLVRGFDVLRAVGDQHLNYQGLVRDAVGRQGIGFAYHDPASRQRTLLVFDADTGRLNGTVVHADALAPVPTLFGAYANFYDLRD